MYKVFIKDRPLFFCLSRPSNQEPSHVIFEGDIEHSNVVNQLEQEGTCFVLGNPNERIHQFFSKYKFLQAAGGLVKNQDGDYLCILRLGKWDLPKGKLEKGESIAECAVREVEEECGIEGLKIIRELPSTFHTYEHKNKNVLKRTYWFEMTTSSVKQLIPQIEEGIEKVEWLKDLQKVRDNTYNSILDVLNSI